MEFSVLYRNAKNENFCLQKIVGLRPEDLWIWVDICILDTQKYLIWYDQQLWFHLL